MKGYNTEDGYMGFVDGEYQFFASEADYRDCPVAASKITKPRNAGATKQGRKRASGLEGEGREERCVLLVG